MTKIFLIFGLVVALPVGASAAKIILCSNCDPTPIVLTSTNGALGDVQATNTDGDDTYEFLNETGTILDDLSFTTTINAGLDPTTLENDGDFECTAPNGFYLNCAVTYDPTTGALTTYYFGVNPPDWQDLPVVVIFEDLVGSGFGDTGIPNLGLFEVELTGWTPGLTDPDTGQTLYNSLPTFTNSYNVPVNVPEPSTALTFAADLSLFGAVLALLGRKRKWKWALRTRTDSTT